MIEKENGRLKRQLADAMLDVALVRSRVKNGLNFVRDTLVCRLRIRILAIVGRT